MRLALIALVAVLLTACDSADVYATVHNSGAEPLDNVVIRTDQESYPLGDVPPGEHVVQGIDVLGDSDFAVTHTGRQDWQTIDIYLTRGFTGTVRLELRGGEVVGFTDNIRIYP